MNEEEIYKAAINHWGEHTQLMMAMGECGELIAELNRLVTQNRSSKEQVVDEIADVEIMMGQLRYIFGNDEVDLAKQRKLARLNHRLIDQGV
jgi:NTP pyrophosphatase (non-canonical NTP hydrolase)